MKRKTNLFYTSGEDNNFIIFSNYTEALTGNFLSTDHKLFPSRFMCMKFSDQLDDEKKKALIKQLVCQYENKIACLSDYLNSNGNSTEEKLQPLNYLLEALAAYDPDFNITFISDITEQDYNGIYADIICIVDNIGKHGTLVINEDADKDTAGLSETEDILHGWERLPDVYSDYEPIYDNGSTYNIKGSYTSITLENNDTNNDASNSIEFDIVIPLFDYVDINSETNDIDIDETETNISLTENAMTHNIPLGIWFANRRVSLTPYKGYMPAWSIVLSMQFKPFPYADKFTVSNIENSDRSNAFTTYAELLKQQADINRKYRDMQKQIVDLQTQLTGLKEYVNVLLKNS